MKNALILFALILLTGLASCAAPQKAGVAASSAAGDEFQDSGEAGREGAAEAKMASGPLPKVAVYVTGGKTQSENKAFSTRMTHALVGSGKYNTIERADAFLEQVAREMITQMSGAVDDDQISQLGRQAGANFVCVGEIVEAFGASQVSARIMNVESVEVIASGMASGPLETMADFAALSDRVAAQLVGVDQNTAPVSSAKAEAGKPAPQKAAVRTAPAQPAETGQAPADANYRSVKIGDLTWMAENLNFAVKSSWCYGDAAFNCAKYGRLYAWSAAMAVCPSGWHLPDNAEWENLANAVGGKKSAGAKLKSKAGWNDFKGASGNGTDDFGFSALPGGLHYSYGGYHGVGDYGYYWSATEFGTAEVAEFGTSYAYAQFLHYDAAKIVEGTAIKGDGYSVRCVKDY